MVAGCLIKSRGVLWGVLEAVLPCTIFSILQTGCVCICFWQNDSEGLVVLEPLGIFVLLVCQKNYAPA